MKYDELLILLPCHSLEDFPLHYQGDEAAGLLAGWTAIWHPRLIAAVESTPTWGRSDDPPEELAGRLLVIPTVSENELQTGFVARAQGEGARAITGKIDRDEIVALALEGIDGPAAELDRELVADFHALGFCYLQVQLLTRQMRYTSNLDEYYFKGQIVAAAKAAVSGDQEEAQRLLGTCFDVLGEERDHFYPVDAFLIDLTLVADTTLGKTLAQTLASEVPSNVLLSASLLDAMASKAPASLVALQTGLEKGTVSIAGGEEVEHRLPLLDRETVLAQIVSGGASYQRHLQSEPKVYGRRRFGLTPLMPEILRKIGYVGALHVTLDDGRYPEGSQIKTLWEGLDGATIDALARFPLDASRPESMLTLSTKMGESMDHDHVATAIFAHWPGHACQWYEDLRRTAKYTSALGKFVTLEEYFNDTSDGGLTDHFSAGQYQSPYLRQDVDAQVSDPISRVVRYTESRSKANAASDLTTLATLLCGKGLRGKGLDGKSEDTSPLLQQIDAEADTSDQATAARLAERADEAIVGATASFCDALSPGQPGESTDYLIANPCSFARRVYVDVPKLAAAPDLEKPLFAVTDQRIVVDLPPMGFVWAQAGSGARPAKDEPVMVEDNVLRNEFLQARINPVTGTLQSIHDYKGRKNRLSQQLALRSPSAEKNTQQDSAAYSVMAADSVETTVSTSVMGEIVARGRLLDRQGKILSRFQQTYRLWRGSRVLQLEVELDPVAQFDANPWESYLACRFAWAEEAADMWRGTHLVREKVSGGRVEQPLYVDIDMPDARIALLTGGLPYHRRVGLRMLDSLLLVRGESQRQFRLAIGVGLEYPARQAMEQLLPPTVVRGTAPADGLKSGWLFHLDNKNVVATHWAPLVEEGATVGFQVRLLETRGKGGKSCLRCFKKVGTAKIVNYRSSPLADCRVEDDKINLDLAANEWIQLEARWA